MLIHSLRGQLDTELAMRVGANTGEAVLNVLQRILQAREQALEYEPMGSECK